MISVQSHATMDQEAFDLHRLLVAAGEHGPYVVVGQSIGGMVIRIFTEQHPKEVAGVVLIDAFSEDGQFFINGAMRRVRLLAKDRTIPAPLGIRRFALLTTAYRTMRKGFDCGRCSNRRTMPTMTITSRKFPPESMPETKPWAIRSAVSLSLFLLGIKAR